MHEAMVAQSLLNTICAEAEKQNGRPISAKVSCGAFNALNDDVLGMAFEAIAKGTVCEGTQLEIEHKPIRAKCRDCQKEFDFEIANPLCEHCGSDKFELLPDAPLLLEEIEFEAE